MTIEGHTEITFKENLSKPASRLQLERPACCGRQRHRCDRGGARDVSQHQDANFDHCRQHYRPRRAAQAEHGGGAAMRWARTRSPREKILRLAGGRAIQSRRLCGVSRRHRRGRHLRDAWEALFRLIRRRIRCGARSRKSWRMSSSSTGRRSSCLRADANGMATRRPPRPQCHCNACHGSSAELILRPRPRRNDIDGAGTLSPTELGGRTMHFGVREHAMARRQWYDLPSARSIDAFLISATICARQPAWQHSCGCRFSTFTHDPIGFEDGPTISRSNNRRCAPFRYDRPAPGRRQRGARGVSRDQRLRTPGVPGPGRRSCRVRL